MMIKFSGWRVSLDVNFSYYIYSPSATINHHRCETDGEKKKKENSSQMSVTSIRLISVVSLALVLENDVLKIPVPLKKKLTRKKKELESSMKKDSIRKRVIKNKDVKL